MSTATIPTTPTTPTTPTPTLNGLPTTVADIAYPWVGGSQHLCIARHGESVRSKSDHRVLQLEHLHRTVLAGAFFKTQVQVPTLLEAPYDKIRLPPLRRQDLQEEKVWDQHGRCLGISLRVPALFVHANQVLVNVNKQNDRYNYHRALVDMVREAGRLMASVIKNGVLKVREKPGFMAHIQTRSDLPPTQIAISTAFGRKVLRATVRQFPSLLDDQPANRELLEKPPSELNELEQEVLDQVVIRLLDGFPAWMIRFPLANDRGIQAMTLRIVPGKGRAIWVNPWNLEKRFLGDEDGDLGFVFLRVKEFLEGAIAQPRLDPLGEPRCFSHTRSVLSLHNLWEPDRLIQAGVKEKTVRDKVMPADLSNTLLRKEAIHNADTRQHVAVYTMAIGWWCSRVLGTAGGMSMKDAYAKAYTLLEWYMENCMDARKGKGNSAFASAHAWDPYQHMETLLQGGEMDWQMLDQIGIPTESLNVLRLAWQLSEGSLRSHCARSPVYWSLVLRRRSMETSIVKMLEALMKADIPATEIFSAIVNDLSGAAVTYWPDGMNDEDEVSDAAEYGELIG